MTEATSTPPEPQRDREGALRRGRELLERLDREEAERTRGVMKALAVSLAAAAVFIAVFLKMTR